ncbi:UNVERIFIED_CONTAM: hypothetical protein PYX00_008483 [Menopon gallinae]|uniref:USP domain-containing protein n=1 Tax=Menopon gallinae TaxID=328185 RepID=A0AAW2HN69_9NEOP
MTILHSKNSQKGDSDDPPPKKKSKKSKALIRSQTQSHVSHPTTSSGAGPSHCLPEQIGLKYSFLSPSHTYYTSSESEPFLSSPQHYFGQTETELQHYYGQPDQEIVKFKLDKFDVGIYPDQESDPYTFEEEYESQYSTPVQDPAIPGTSQTNSKSKIVDKNQIYNPNCLEYYIYGPGSRSPNSKKSPPKRVLPNINLIEVISSEEIISQDRDQLKSENVVDDSKFEGGSLLDDINNFDIDDKFGELEKFQQEAIWEDSKMYHMEKNLEPGVTINGCDKISAPEGPHYENRLIRNSPTASLSNLGNTCFLNSVLYTLRFAPNFLHNLHHLVKDMNFDEMSNSQIKQKTSSLGRNMSLSWNSSKELVSNGAGDASGPIKTKKQIVTEKLHEVYEAMRLAETKDHIDPFHPDVFLTALREVNPIFEGNQQQDAHELLVCLLDIFRETCQASARQAETRAAFEMNNYSNTQSGGDSENGVLKMSSSNINKSWGGVMAVRNSLKVRTQECLKSRKNEKNASFNNNPVKKKNKRELECMNNADGTDNTDATAASSDSSSDMKSTVYEEKGRLGFHNFVAQDFEGVMVLQTTCLECENTTEKKEPFADICVPIKTDYNEDDDDPMDPMNPSDLYQRAVVTDEFLKDRNKYYCEECLRYNEARRSVRYQTLPRLLTLQLKRFSSTYGAMSKVTQYMPTPMTLSCFCEECRCLDRTKSFGRHGYDLYGVIMHLGPNMAGGHYIAYVKATDNLEYYRTCVRDKSRKGSSLSSASGKASNHKANSKLYNFFKNKGSGSNSINDKINGTKIVANNFTNPRKICHSLECCGVKSKMADLLITGGSDCIKDDRMSDGLVDETVWIACDDDNVKILRGSQVEELLAKNFTSNATPYLLFYSRRTE